MTRAGLGASTGVRPWRVETFKFFADPELVAKVSDVVGLYLEPPENAIVLCVNELCDASHYSSDVKPSVM